MSCRGRDIDTYTSSPSPLSPEVVKALRNRAVQALDAAIDRGFAAATVLHARGSVALEQGDNEGAVHYLQAALEVSARQRREAAAAGGPAEEVLLGDSVKDAHTWNQLGLAFAAGKHFQPAFEAMTTGLALDPSVEALSVNLATVLGNLGRHKDAVRILERCIASNKAKGKPASMSILNNLGVAELDLGRPEAALRHFMRAEAGLRAKGVGADDPWLVTVLNNVQRARGLTTSRVGA